MMLRMDLARLYHELGRQDDMLAVLEVVVEYLENEVAAGVRHPGALAQLAYAHALRGDRDAFLQTLDLAVDYGHWNMHICCRDYWSDEQRRAFALDIPGWLEDFKGDPDFEIIKARMRSIVDAQRANIRALLEANSMEQLLASSVVPWEIERMELEASGN